MSDSTQHLDTIQTSQAGKEVTANAMFDASSPASLFGRRASTSAALTWGFYGGKLMIDGTPTNVANGTVSLTASATNYIEADRSGTVSKNTTGFTAGRIPLYTAVTDANAVTSYTDQRTPWYPLITGRLAKAFPSDANYTLTAAEARNRILEFTGTLTAQRNVVVPLPAQEWVVFNNTTGGFGVQVIGATGTGIVIGAGKRAIVYADGTNVVRVSADT